MLTRALLSFPIAPWDSDIINIRAAITDRRDVWVGKKNEAVANKKLDLSRFQTEFNAERDRISKGKSERYQAGQDEVDRLRNLLTDERERFSNDLKSRHDDWARTPQAEGASSREVARL